MCSACHPDLKSCVSHCLPPHLLGCFLLCSSPCVSTCKVVGNYIRFFFFSSQWSKILGAALIICQARHLWLRTGAANPLLDLPALLASNENQESVFWGDLPLPPNAFLLYSLPTYWQGSEFVADQWSHILPLPPQTLQLWDRRFWCGFPGVLSFM